VANLSMILGAAETGVEAATKKVNNPILPTANEFFWAAVFFCLLWALMKFVLLPPVLRVMKERADKQREDLAAAEAAELQMDESRQQYEASLAGVKTEALGMVEAARSEADAYRAEKMTAAEAEAAQIRAASAAEVAAARATALAELQGSITDIAVGAAEAVTERPIDRDAQARVIEDYVNSNDPGR
jgi:F-type H+-transporting ATPase subunit b